MTFAVTALIFLLAGFMQGAAGFSFAVLSIPLLVWNGFSLAEASMLMAVNGFAVSSVMVFRLRQHMKWRILVPTFFLRIFTVALGIFLLTMINNLDRTLIRQLLGLLLIVIVVIQVIVQPKAREVLHSLWWWLAFGVGGMMTGMVGFGGPPAVLWVMAHNWPPLESRALLSAFFWSVVPIQVILLLLSFGQPMFETAQYALYFTPIAIAAILLGIWWGNKLDKEKLRRVGQGLLLLTGVSSLLAPLLGLG